MTESKQQSALELPEQWDETVDVIVIGSGFAGLSAAAEARTEGAEVIILEKMPYFGGNSVIAGGGYCCWDSRLKLREKLGLGADSPELHIEDTLKSGGFLNDPALVEILVREAPAGLDWLLDAGAFFKETLNRIGGHSAYRSHHADCNLAKVLKQHTLSLGVQLRLNTTVTALCRNGNKNAVSCVRVQIDDVEKSIKARNGIVIASGGFGSDAAMRMAYQPDIGPAYGCTNHKGATGEMIRYAQKLGADVLDMEHIQLFPCAEPESGAIDTFALDCYSGPGYGLIYVDQDGRRFVNELEGRDVVSDAQIKAEKKPTYSILNGEIFKLLGRSDKSLEQGVASGRLYRAGTLGELAKTVGIPYEVLIDTAARQNESVQTGIDPNFGRPATGHMIPLTEGPFYAIAQWPSVHYTMGGLRIDTHTRVLDTQSKPIPNLFAAGEVCGGIHGKNRLGGNAIAECVVFGRIAGKNATIAR